MRIESLGGNVIAADFRPQPKLTIDIAFETRVLYCDEAVCLIRITYLLNGEPVGMQHVTAETPPINNTEVTP